MKQNDRIIRMMEAIFFASTQPLTEDELSSRLPDEIDVNHYLELLMNKYSDSGVNLTKVAGGWSFRTAPDLSFLLEKERTVTRRLSRAAIETLAIIAYHQPITRAEIEEIRGVALSKGTVDLLMEANWVILKGRKKAPGRPVMYGTSIEFLNHFGLDNVEDLPGIEELKATGLLNPEPPQKNIAHDEEQTSEN
tara:strand:+ start:227 stop:805 length:579 start_codon:yes stop_codon:yes gene_type:complete